MSFLSTKTGRSKRFLLRHGNTAEAKTAVFEGIEDDLADRKRSLWVRRLVIVFLAINLYFTVSFLLPSNQSDRDSAPLDTVVTAVVTEVEESETRSENRPPTCRITFEYPVEERHLTRTTRELSTAYCSARPGERITVAYNHDDPWKPVVQDSAYQREERRSGPSLFQGISLLILLYLLWEQWEYSQLKRLGKKLKSEVGKQPVDDWEMGRLKEEYVNMFQTPLAVLGREFRKRDFY